MSDSNESPRILNMVLGLATVGPAAVGLISLMSGVLATAIGDLIGAGVCYFASAVAFGLQSHSIWGS